MKKYALSDIGHLLSALKWLLTYDDMLELQVDDSYVYVPRHFNVKGLGKPLNAPPIWSGNKLPPLPIKFPPRKHQVRAIQKLLEKQEGILNLACGKGKTYCALNLFSHLAVPTAVVVDKSNLIYQWQNAIEEHIDRDVDVGIVKSNKWKYKNKDITIISIGTLVSRHKNNKIPEGFFDSFGLVIFDECHHLAANSLRKIAPLFPYKRLGLSATPKREDGNEEVFFNHLGPIIYSDLKQDLIPEVSFHTLPTSPELPVSTRAVNGEINHRRLCSYLGSIDERNNYIFILIDQLLQEKHKVLCLTHSVDHVELLKNILPSKVKAKTSFVTGSTLPQERNYLIEEADVSVATIDIAAEALDVPRLSAVIVLTPFGARQEGNTLFQVLGRIQRTAKNKTHPVAIFLEDENIGMCKNLMHQIRRRLYDARIDFTRNGIVY